MRLVIPKEWELFGIKHKTTVVDGPLDTRDSAVAEYYEPAAEIRMCKIVENRVEIFYHELTHAMLSTFNADHQLKKNTLEMICDIVGIGIYNFLSNNDGLFEEENDG